VAASETSTAGWREWLSMPELGVPWVKAKLDTGARSSALHAYGLERGEEAGIAVVRFEVHPWQRSSLDAAEVVLPVIDERLVRSSTGHPELRPVVRVDLTIVGRTVPADVTLTRRDEMGFRMLVGREALRGRFVVDPGRSYLGPRPPRALRLRNHVDVPPASS
jgi:hypothetical protein